MRERGAVRVLRVVDDLDLLADAEPIVLADVDAHAVRHPAGVCELDIDVLVEAVAAVASAVERCARDCCGRVGAVLDERVFFPAEVPEAREAPGDERDAEDHE